MCNDVLIATFRLYPYTFYGGLIPLRNATLSDLADTEALKNRFKIETEGKTYIFSCPSLEEKKQWLADLQNKTILKKILEVDIPKYQNIIREGTLEKASRGLKTLVSSWSQKYCILEDNILYYYNAKTQADAKQVTCKSINLQEYKLIKLSASQNKQYCFELQPINPMKEGYIFAALSSVSVLYNNVLQKEYDEWMHDVARFTFQANNKLLSQTNLITKDLISF